MSDNYESLILGGLILSILHCLISISMIFISWIVKEKRQLSFWILSFIVFVIIIILLSIVSNESDDNTDNQNKKAQIINTKNPISNLMKKSKNVTPKLSQNRPKISQNKAQFKPQNTQIIVNPINSTKRKNEPYKSMAKLGGRHKM